ncbi:MAG: hypothetical protein U0K36_03700 [Bacteroidales bacterium]|nr:hypothetical protein [Bacteroidales bacterium]
MTTDIFQWTTLFLPPISAAVAWVAGRRRRTRDNLEALQETLDKFITENSELYEEIMKLRRENAQLRTSISALEAKLDSLTKKNALANGKL